MPAEGTPAPDAPPSVPPAGDRGPARHRALLFGVTAAVAVGVVVAILFATGVIHPASGGTPASSPFLTFSQAETTAQTASATFPGGPWYAIVAVAITAPTSFLEPTSNITSTLAQADCNFTYPSGQPPNIGIPATGPRASTGASAFWTVALKNASNGLVLYTVSDGVAAAMLTASGPDCARTVGFIESFPAGTYDSPAIIAAANAVGGSAFLAAHPNATELWAAVGGVVLGILGSTTPEWFVEYTSCTFPAVSGETGAIFNATLGGLTGKVISSYNNTTTPCSLAPPTAQLDRGAPAPLSAVAMRKAI
jgi:hypothetical protein